MFYFNEKHFRSELKYLRQLFHQNNGYSHWLITRVFQKLNEDLMRQYSEEPLPCISMLIVVKKQRFSLPYSGQKNLHACKIFKKPILREHCYYT